MIWRRGVFESPRAMHSLFYMYSYGAVRAQLWQRFKSTLRTPIVTAIQNFFLACKTTLSYNVLSGVRAASRPPPRLNQERMFTWKDQARPMLGCPVHTCFKQQHPRPIRL
jgi:hypothetical protein